VVIAVSSDDIQVVVLATNSDALLGVGDALELRFVVAEEDVFELELERGLDEEAGLEALTMGQYIARHFKARPRDNLRQDSKGSKLADNRTASNSTKKETKTTLPPNISPLRFPF
jgi:hypothetical protein